MSTGNSKKKTKSFAPPEQQQAAAAVGSLSQLPPEIILDILTKVTIKTLSRCRLVCKSWHHTIRSPTFISTYISNSARTTNDGNRCLILQNPRTSELVDRDLRTFTLKLPRRHNITPTDYSAGGFLLLISRTLVNKYRNYYFTYFVCNPVTGDYISVPRSPFFDRSDDLTIGFGYDPVSEVCKLVRILTVYDLSSRQRVTKVETCDVCTGKWTVTDGEELLTKSLYPSTHRISLESIDLISTNFRPCVFVNGAIHWLGYRKESRDMAIVAFKLDTEEFYDGMLPFSFNKLRNDLCASERQPYLLVVRECLSVVNIVGHHENVEIWVMKDFGLNLTWEKKYVIDNVVMDNGHLIQGAYMPVEFMQNGEIIMLSSLGKKMGYYQPATKVVKFWDSIDLSASYWRPLLHECSLKSPRSISK